MYTPNLSGSCRSGNVVMENETHQEHLQVNGLFKATNCTFNKGMTINGSATVNDSKFHQETVINGLIKSYGCHFFGLLSISSSNSQFYNSKVSNIVIRPISQNERQVVFLYNNTIVEGNITFEKPGGLVKIIQGSEVKGGVINGEIVRQNSL